VSNEGGLVFRFRDHAARRADETFAAQEVDRRGDPLGERSRFEAELSLRLARVDRDVPEQERELPGGDEQRESEGSRERRGHRCEISVRVCNARSQLRSAPAR